jgi:capsular polysaccharide biosynthesis protein
VGSAQSTGKQYAILASMVVEREQSGFVEATGSGDALPVRTLLNIFRRRMWVILLVAILFTGLVVGYTFLRPPVYQASSTILIGQGKGILEVPADAQNIVMLTPTLAETITSRSIAEEVVEDLKLQDTSPKRVAKNTYAENITNTQLIEITYSDTSPKRAQRVAQTIGFVFVKRFNEETPRNPSFESSSSLSAEVWDKAIMPTEPSNRDLVRNGVLALLIGSLLGAGLAFLLEYLDDRVRSLEELKRICGVPAVGIIPKHKTKSDKKSANR